jgi:hypothetical protein
MSTNAPKKVVFGKKPSRQTTLNRNLKIVDEDKQKVLIFCDLCGDSLFVKTNDGRELCFKCEAIKNKSCIYRNRIYCKGFGLLYLE